MITLFNSCTRSEISVTPKNWNTQKASVKKPWRIHYRFYDPAFKDDIKLKGCKQVPIKGMNDFKTLKERQDVTRALIDNEKHKLDTLGYNPITGQFMAPTLEDSAIKEIDPDTNFITALTEASKKIEVVRDVLIDINSVIRGVEKAAEKLYDNRLCKSYRDIGIKDISTKHIKYILEQCGKNNKRWSNNRFNMYKAYLSMLFEELKQLEATEVNPTWDIKAKPKLKKIRAILTPAEEKLIDNHLRNNHYTFWRYLRIFFRSGSRTTEMLQLRKNQRINLENQEFIITVKKGKKITEQIRPITDDVLHLWKEIWIEAKEGQVLFSRGLIPGDHVIRKDQIGRRWAKYVKATVNNGGLNIKKDFYSLKHLNTDKIAEAVDLQHAQQSTGHTNEITTLLYAVNESKRRINKLKTLQIPFAG